VSTSPGIARHGWRWFWWFAFAALALYVAARIEVFSLSSDVATAAGTVGLPNTFASVDHPFHVARADALWDALTSGHTLRWVGQHQGGYPVEFYPLGEAWLEVLIRALSIGTLSAEGAHSLAVAFIFLLPGVAFAALAQADRWPLAVGLLAFALHVSLPGSWYHGGYTELVQWGLVTNVAGAVAALLMLPPLIRFLRNGSGWMGALASALAAWAVYCNPRSILGLGALAVGAWLAVALLRDGGLTRFASRRLVSVALIAALLAAPLLMALARFGSLYTFVHYSGYEGIADYVAASASAVSWPVLVLGLGGTVFGLFTRQRVAATAAAVSLVLYVLLTTAVAFAPPLAQLAPQLEPTRLMPLQRLLVIYLAAVAVWVVLDRVVAGLVAHRSWLAQIAVAGMALAVVVTQTRPLAGPVPDPASPEVPAVSLYPVAMSAQPQQFDLELAVRAADEAAAPGTAILVLGSALSWHQQLWSPLWTARSLFYDNWLWYWHPDHAGTPGYRFLAGHHYPDPEQTLEPAYLARHGIGAVVVTGATRSHAAVSPLLAPLRTGVYDAYAVRDPVTTVTFGDARAALLELGQQRIDTVAEIPGQPVVARVNWYPRWEVQVDDQPVPVHRLDDGYLAADPGEPARAAHFVYRVQPLDWAARFLALVGLAALALMVRRAGWRGTTGPGWYARQPGRDAGSRNRDARSTGDDTVAEHASG
jgi:hypothetical protein